MNDFKQVLQCNMASDKIQVVEEFIYNNLQKFLYICEYRLQQKKKKKNTTNSKEQLQLNGKY